ACPENALQITETALAWDPARCTGCNSCTAVCFSAAIRIEHQLQAATPQRYPFAVKTCRSCHHTFYTFSPEADRCHICQRHAFAMREA
ncbi:MAG TPA: ferredoxin, partial [Enterobacter sp.]|nr:ferredoxin [Enterobacter sp.]